MQIEFPSSFYFFAFEFYMREVFKASHRWFVSRSRHPSSIENYQKLRLQWSWSERRNPNFHNIFVSSSISHHDEDLLTVAHFVKAAALSLITLDASIRFPPVLIENCYSFDFFVPAFECAVDEEIKANFFTTNYSLSRSTQRHNQWLLNGRGDDDDTGGKLKLTSMYERATCFDLLTSFKEVRRLKNRDLVAPLSLLRASLVCDVITLNPAIMKLCISSQ